MIEAKSALQPSLLRLFGAESGRRTALVCAVWPHAVGAELARRTTILEWRGATLRVGVPDAAWRKALHALQPTLRAKLRAALGPLAPARLSFQERPGEPDTGGLLAAQDTDTHAAAGDEPAEASAELRARAASIPDDEIRARFLETATRALVRARRNARAKESRCAKP